MGERQVRGKKSGRISRGLVSFASGRLWSSVLRFLLPSAGGCSLPTRLSAGWPGSGGWSPANLRSRSRESPPGSLRAGFCVGRPNHQPADKGSKAQISAESSGGTSTGGNTAGGAAGGTSPDTSAAVGGGAPAGGAAGVGSTGGVSAGGTVGGIGLGGSSEAPASSPGNGLSGSTGAGSNSSGTPGVSAGATGSGTAAPLGPSQARPGSSLGDLSVTAGPTLTGSLPDTRGGPGDSEWMLPASLAPLDSSSAQERRDGAASADAMPPLKGRPGASLSVVSACREAIITASRPHGVTRVDVASAGLTRTGRQGAVLAPLEARLVYQRGGDVQVRRSRVTCQVAASGVVTAIR